MSPPVVVMTAERERASARPVRPAAQARNDLVRWCLEHRLPVPPPQEERRR